jgi:hypothetical protein
MRLYVLRMDWAAKRAWADEEHDRRMTTPAGEGERDDLRRAGIAGASWAGGLAALMAGDGAAASALLVRAAEEYRTSAGTRPRREVGDGPSRCCGAG